MNWNFLQTQMFTAKNIIKIENCTVIATLIISKVCIKKNVVFYKMITWLQSFKSIYALSQNGSLNFFACVSEVVRVACKTHNTGKQHFSELGWSSLYEKVGLNLLCIVTNPPLTPMNEVIFLCKRSWKSYKCVYYIWYIFSYPYNVIQDVKIAQ